MLEDEAINRAWLYRAMQRAQRRAKMVEDGRVHILRHTFCSRLAAANVPMLTIKELQATPTSPPPSATCTCRSRLRERASAR
jgi:hypothetical protein